MVFPATPLPLKTELLLAGTWTDVTALTYQRDGYTITRGRQSEGGTASPSTCTMTFNNRSGNFSPRNPLGTYYGSIGRNTQMRVSLPATTSHLYMTGVAGDGATCPDNARIDITGDIDIRIDAWLPSWATITDLIGKYNATGNQRSYEMYVDASGVLVFIWSADGTVKNTVASTVPVPAPITGRKAVRVTLQVNNGSAGNTVTFYTSDTIAGSWTQLGAAVVTAGVTSIFNSTALLYVGDIAGSSGGVVVTGNPPRARIYAAKVLAGIGGVEKANPDFTAQTDGATTFADAAGNTWTVNGTATIVKRLYRFWGEVSEWPSKWDTTGTDVYVPVTASGIMRRLGTGATPTKSAYFRGCTSIVAPVTALQAYWPCEDSVGSASIASRLSTGGPMGIVGTPVFAADSASFLCSASLPTMGSASFVGSVSGYAGTGQVQVRLLMAIPAGGTTNGAVLLRVFTDGTVNYWDMAYSTGGGVTLNAYDASGTLLGTSGIIAFAVDGTAFRLSLQLTQSGGNINYSMVTLNVGAATGLTSSGTLAGQSITRAAGVVVAPNRNMSGVTVGHVTVQSAVTSAFEQADLLAAYSGETAPVRFARLCAEENIGAQVSGTTAQSTAMGSQLQKTLLDLLRECETTDGGVMYEPREFFGLAYRSLRSLVSRAAVLTLNYPTADLSGIEPVEDDRFIVNDVTVSRAGGSSTRYTVTSGALSTLDPPDGVGTYPTQPSVSAYNDATLPGIASWMAHIGTSDYPRFTSLAVDLARPTFTGSAAQTLAVETLDVGDRVVIQNPPAWMPPEDITQLAIGFTERLNAFTFGVGLVGVPENPYHVVVWSDGGSRWSSAGSTLAAGVTSVGTSLSVATPGGVLWGHGDGNFDVLIGGEQMTVTAVAGTTTPQTFTVTRAVNGIVKAHGSGESVGLFDPRYWSM